MMLQCVKTHFNSLRGKSISHAITDTSEICVNYLITVLMYVLPQ